MCQFLSAVVTKDEIYTSDVSDSHEDILQANNLKDDPTVIVRVEYTSDTKHDVDSYALSIDQDEIPDWFTEKRQEQVTRALKRIVKRMVLTTGNYRMLLGGKWVLAGDVQVDDVKSACIVSMSGSSSIGSMYDSSRIVTDNRVKK
jgi:hypothetical protein